MARHLSFYTNILKYIFGFSIHLTHVGDERTLFVHVDGAKVDKNRN